MPVCPKCCNELIKRKSDNSYHCRRHGFAREIISPLPSMSIEELSKIKITSTLECEYQPKRLTVKGIK